MLGEFIRKINFVQRGDVGKFFDGYVAVEVFVYVRDDVEHLNHIVVQGYVRQKFGNENLHYAVYFKFGLGCEGSFRLFEHIFFEYFEIMLVEFVRFHFRFKFNRVKEIIDRLVELKMYKVMA